MKRQGVVGGRGRRAQPESPAYNSVLRREPGTQQENLSARGLSLTAAGGARSPRPRRRSRRRAGWSSLRGQSAGFPQGGGARAARKEGLLQQRSCECVGSLSVPAGAAEGRRSSEIWPRRALPRVESRWQNIPGGGEQTRGRGPLGGQVQLASGHRFSPAGEQKP